MTPEATTQSETLTLATLLREFFTLTKPRVVALITFTAIVGMFLAVPGLPDLMAVAVATIGIGLSAASGAAVNHVLDAETDSVMRRTRNRPLPNGRIETRHAIAFAAALATLSMIVLALGINVLTAALTFCTFVGYAVVYTVFLKHATPQNIVIGGAAGAMPPVLGWTAMTGELHTDAFLLFLIIFCWTPPHFWALALYRELDYSSAGIPMLPVTHGQKYTLLQILLYTILLASVTVMPFATGMFGLPYLGAALVLSLIFVAYAIRLFRSYSDSLARKTFRFSIQYLALLFAAMLVDHYWQSAI